MIAGVEQASPGTDPMRQDRIWEHFQNEGVGSFDGNRGRLHWLARQIRPGERVLNIGLGNAAFETFAQQRGAEVYCLDPDPRAVARAAADLGLGSRAMAGRSDAIPLPDRHLDVVVMSEVLEHLTEAELAATLREIRRVLRPRGRFLGTVPAFDDLAANMVVCPHCAGRFHRWGHLRSFDSAQLELTLRSAGFERVRSGLRAFPDLAGRNLLGLARGWIRITLGRLGLRIAIPNLAFSAENP